jgi:hypothetical protein
VDSERAGRRCVLAENQLNRMPRCRVARFFRKWTEALRVEGTPNGQEGQSGVPSAQRLEEKPGWASVSCWRRPGRYPNRPAHAFSFQIRSWLFQLESGPPFLEGELDKTSQLRGAVEPVRHIWGGRGN